MRNHDELTLLRAAWVSSYWHQHEFRGDLSDFGFTAIYDGKLLGIEPKQLDRAPTIGGKAKMPAPPPTILCSSDLNGAATSVNRPRVVSKYFSKELRPGDRFDNPLSVDASEVEGLAWLEPSR